MRIFEQIDCSSSGTINRPCSSVHSISSNTLNRNRRIVLRVTSSHVINLNYRVLLTKMIWPGCCSLLQQFRSLATEKFINILTVDTLEEKAVNYQILHIISRVTTCINIYCQFSTCQAVLKEKNISDNGQMCNIFTKLLCKKCSDFKQLFHSIYCTNISSFGLSKERN